MSWVEYTKNKTSILSQLSNHNSIIANENRKYMETIIISIRMLAIQGIAFRWHIENESSVNERNFLELLNIISHFDNLIKNKMDQKVQDIYIILFKMK